MREENNHPVASGALDPFTRDLEMGEVDDHPVASGALVPLTRDLEGAREQHHRTTAATGNEDRSFELAGSPVPSSHYSLLSDDLAVSVFSRETWGELTSTCRVSQRRAIP